MSGVVRPVLHLLVRRRDSERADRGGAVPRHAPNLASHFDRRSLAVGARNRDHRLRKRRIEFGGKLGEQPPRLTVGEQRHAFGMRLRASDDGDSPAIHRLPDEILSVEHRALERSEYAAGCDLAMIDRKARHFRIRIHVRQVPQPHRSPYSLVS